MLLGEAKKIIDEMVETIGPGVELKIETGNYICELREIYAIIPKIQGKYVLFSEHIEEYRNSPKKRKGREPF